MNRFVWLFVALVGLGLVGWVLQMNRGDGDQFERLKRERTKLAEQRETRRDPRELPPSLDSRRMPEGYWFVGKTGEEVGVEIPFAPGKQRNLPTKKVAPSALDQADSGQTPADASGTQRFSNPDGFVGPQACAACHADMYESFLKTAHARTSRLANEGSILGPLAAPGNHVKTFHPDVSFTMKSEDGQCVQDVAFFDWNFTVPMDLITGSGKMAQTFLFWEKDRLFQHNMTYLSTADRWVNSPGYLDADAAYARPIGNRCLECHTTYAEFQSPPNQFDPESLILGVSCERCHGPGQQHVDYHAANPDDKQARHITVATDLSRDRELDVCSQCHAGASELKGDAYAFRPGDELDVHYHEVDNGKTMTVHTSNQRERMEMSPCFQQTEMTCIDCHNPHQYERGNSALFSQRCQQCHQVDQCGIFGQLPSELDGDQIASLKQNCVDCHMPSEGSDTLKMQTATNAIFPPLRDHRIRVDWKATKRLLESLQ